MRSRIQSLVGLIGCFDDIATEFVCYADLPSVSGIVSCHLTFNQKVITVMRLIRCDHFTLFRFFKKLTR